MANLVYIATSLDGYIATSDGGLEWLTEIPNPEHNDYGFTEFLARVDAIVMGRNTFDVVLSFGQWPYTRKVFVLSNTLEHVPDHLIGRAEIIFGNPVQIVKDLHQRGYTDLYIDGGQVIQSFLSEGLVDEMIITRVPVLLGDGIPLFRSLEAPLHFTKVTTEVLSDLLVKSHYFR